MCVCVCVYVERGGCGIQQGKQACGGGGGGGGSGCASVVGTLLGVANPKGGVVKAEEAADVWLVTLVRVGGLNQTCVNV